MIWGRVAVLGHRPCWPSPGRASAGGFFPRAPEAAQQVAQLPVLALDGRQVVEGGQGAAAGPVVGQDGRGGARLWRPSNKPLGEKPAIIRQAIKARPYMGNTGRAGRPARTPSRTSSSSLVTWPP